MMILLLAFKFFLLMDSPGNIPLYTSLLREIPLDRQRKIIFREMLIALFVILSFNFLGKPFLNFLDISDNTVKVAGGIILFMIAIKLIFPPEKHAQHEGKHIEPFIVPLAIPLIAGPAVLAAVIIYSKQQQTHLVMMLSITLAWIMSLIVLLLSPLLSRKLGQKGVTALERLMGLVLTLIAVEMFLQGLQLPSIPTDTA